MDIIILLFSLVVLFFSVVIHELAHGYTALSLGDPTAKYEGRLTLNPLKHLDPFGSVILPLLLVLARSPILIGWAKPVPVNPYNFRDQKWGQLKVALAGPATNFAIAIIFGLLVRFFGFYLEIHFVNFLAIVSFYNFLWAIFNLVPIPPLDGSWILFNFLPERFFQFKLAFQQYGSFILIFFIFFGGMKFLGIMAQIMFSFFTGNVGSFLSF